MRLWRRFEARLSRDAPEQELAKELADVWAVNLIPVAMSVKANPLGFSTGLARGLLLMLHRFLIFCALTVGILAPAARAQLAPAAPLDAPAFSAPTPDLLAPELEQIKRDFGRGFYDDVIYRANDLIGDDANDAADAEGNSHTTDPRLIYWRGLIYYQLGWYSEAIADLRRAQNAGVESQPGGWSATALLAKIGEVQPFVPPLERDISSGGQVVFRVHYVRDNAATRAAVSCLAPAYRVSRALFGSDVVATTVYIFDSYAQFAALYNARVGHPPESWVAAVTIDSILCLPLRGRDGSSTLDANPDFFRNTVAHEFNHAMLHRLMGTAELPDWFIEGIAQVAGGQITPDSLQSNNYNIARLFAVNALIAPAKLEDARSFGDHTGLGARLGAAGAGILAPSPYDQGYSLTRFLLANMKPGDLPAFLNLVRDQNEFASAFERQFGSNLPQFYQSWYEATARALRGR